MTAHPGNNGEFDTTTKGNTRVITRLMFLVVAMFGFGFALVPLYDVFCDVTGINGKTGGQFSSSDEMKVDESREIKVQFIASLNENMPWEFKPMTSSVTVHPGQPTRIEYMARNRTNHAIIGQAVPSVAPGLAAQYFHKTECFCFMEQTLEAGERKQMPVVFVIDPELSDDINELTLSYTFFIKPGSEAKQEPLAFKTNQEL